MPSYKKKTSFANSEQMAEIKAILDSMVENTSYNTKSSFSINTELYPDSLMPFTDKHMQYLVSHGGINPNQYLANLRLMTRVSS